MKNSPETIEQPHESSKPDWLKDELVTYIIDSFQSPERWPMTDIQRVRLLTELYNKALLIRSIIRSIK